VDPLVVLDSVSIRYGIKLLVREVSLSIRPEESWAIVGGNGAGKTVLTEAIAGLRKVSGGSIEYPGLEDPERQIQVVSFEAQRRLIETERKRDESNILHGAADPGTTVRRFLEAAAGSLAGHTTLLRRFALEEVLDRGLKYLSTGEIRKTLLCRALLLEPRLLILDDPFDGLDVASRKELSELIEHLAEGNHALLVVLGRRGEIPPGVDRIVLMDGGRALYVGEASGMPDSFGEATPVTEVPLPAGSLGSRPGAPETLIRMDGVSVSYGNKRVFRDITWEARPGEVWHIIGPNGSGKTTLLSLIDGSNPKAYGRRFWLFGRLRGSGESVWEIKERVGHVSADFHRNYPVRTTAIDTILSGFSDTAGLYEEPSGLHIDTARQWLALLDLADQESTPLGRLSYGQQRTLLVARAMVKMPPILIADEPTQGLDDEHGELVLSVLERIGTETETLVLYVSHDPTQRLRCTTHRMLLEPDPAGSRARVEAVAGPVGTGRRRPVI
jgi:molybdate transport system ATP-binding protein